MSFAVRSRVEVRSGALASVAQAFAGRTDVFLVTDENVAAILPPPLETVSRRVIPPGEASKSWERLGGLLLDLDAAGLDRDGHVLAVGGGVVTDLAGLAASLHRRGTPWTAVPTSLVGQVDAALGGKTAVNLGGGKNTVGSFHPPVDVIVDPAVLATLPPRHLRAGMAEVIKTALVEGAELLEQVEALALEDVAAGRPPAVDVIERCLATKARLVEADLHDTGVRRQLNLGHTFGHAFEALAMPELLHGEAVALGLLCAARLGETLSDGEPGSEARLRRLLDRWQLPVDIDLPAEDVVVEMRRDKKRRSGHLVLVLPVRPGRLVLEADPGPERLAEGLAAVLAAPR